MTNPLVETSADGAAAFTGVPVDDVIAAAQDLARAGRWSTAARLLDATTATDPQARARLAVAAAEVALEGDWFGGTRAAGGRLRSAEEICATADLDAAGRWDLGFLRLRHDYFDQILGTGTFRRGPDGRDPDVIADLGRRADDLRKQAPDELRHGWAQMYLGLIADNVSGHRDAAPAHYEAALQAGETGDDLLVRQALRQLGDHDHDRGDHQLALERWGRATAVGAGAGAVPGTLSQQLLLAVLARDGGDLAGAATLAREIARWAAALGAARIEADANSFLAGADPTVPPENDS